MALCAPTLYGHYTCGGIQTGLSTNQPHFTLNEKNITLYSGAMHYFRVPKQYWRDRLKKMKAAGLNAVETYVPWNLHQPEVGTFDFGKGGTDMEDFLDVEQFVKTAQEEDLLVLVRPGPYICAEWDFGGLPSWLLRDKNIKVRTSDGTFMGHVAKYFARLLAILAALQFTKGGPIIGFQVENEYGSTKTKGFVPDKKYLRELKDLMKKHGIVELLFTSDAPANYGDFGTLPDLFQTANFDKDPKRQFDALKRYQKNKPTMAMEYWTGWYDHWSEKHHLRNNSEFRKVLDDILQYPASVNMYMFHGGTNWGFMNGANIPKGVNSYQPDITSYDYDAPLAENGDYTEKYHIVKKLLEKYRTDNLTVPPMPEETKRVKYNDVNITQQLKYKDYFEQLNFIKREDVEPMEVLPWNNDSGQSYGYIIYRTQIDIPERAILKIEGYVHDSALIVVDGALLSPPLKTSDDLNKFGYWRLKDGTFELPKKNNATLDIIVENWGRNNFGSLDKFNQFKGLSQNVLLNNKKIQSWEIRPLEFKKKWTTSLQNWSDEYSKKNLTLNKANLIIEETFDTYLDMSKWNTGVVVVNGFVLGRFMHIGPQQTLYLPAPLLKKGSNEIIVFEHFMSHTHISFSENPIFVTK